MQEKNSDKLFFSFQDISSSYTLREESLANQADMKQSIVLFIFVLFCLYKNSEAGPGGFPVGEHIKYKKSNLLQAGKYTRLFYDGRLLGLFLPQGS